MSTLVFLVLVTRGNQAQNNTELNNVTLHLLVLAPFPPPDVHYTDSKTYAAGPFLIPAVDLAVEHINANKSILPGYTLTYDKRNSGCTEEFTTLVNYAGYVFHEVTPVAGIVGPACSDATVAIAPLLARSASRLLMMSFGTSPALDLAIKPEYDTTFRIVESALVYVRVFLCLMKHNRWQKVGALYESERFYFFTTYNEFSPKVSAQGNLIYSSGISDTYLPIRFMVIDRVRVVFVFAGSMLSRRLVCLAFHNNVVYPKLQLIFHDKRKTHFRAIEFKYEGQTYNCSQEEMDLAVEGAIFVNYVIGREASDATLLLSGVNYSEYRWQYNSTLPDNVIPTDDYFNSYYDAMWAMALALHRSIPWFDQHNISLASYRYGMYDATEELRRQLSSVEFEGASGNINFSETQEPHTSIALYQVQCSSNPGKKCEEITIGHFKASNLSVHGANFIMDSITNVTMAEIPVVWGSIAFTIATLLMLLIVILHIVYIHCRNLPTIKATSLNLTHLVFAGCYLFSIRSMVVIVGSMFRFSISSHPLVHSILCSVPWWSFAFGTSLVWGSVGARMWRVYRIFSTFQQSHRLLSDFTLTCFVIFLLAIDTCYFVVVNAVSPCILSEQDRHFNDFDSLLNSYTVHVRCSCFYGSEVWTYLYDIYKWIIIVICSILAILTRNVHIAKYKHSRAIGILVYCHVAVQSVEIPLSLVFGRYDYVTFVVTFIVSSLYVLFCIVLLFLPPLLPLVTIVKGRFLRFVSYPL